MREFWKAVIALLVVSVFAAVFVSAQPIGVDEIVQVDSTRFNITGTPTAINAQAGNVTELAINATALTTAWQGYYGNVTGTLILADSAGNNMYDWNVSTPSGEVYASRSNSVTWSAIACASNANVTVEETYLGQTTDDPDSVNNTFSGTAPDFDVGSTTVSGCYGTNAYDENGAQISDFHQALLSDGPNIVYSTLLNSSVGFNSNTWDFELLVGENGKVGNEAVTPYYFYVELQ